MKEKRISNFNIANVLTVIRLILVPLFIVAFIEDTDPRRWLAWGIFAIAAFTDKLDGHYARKYNMVTNFGKLADSIADKALIISGLLLLSWHERLWWWVTIVFIVREFGITFMRMVMVKKKVMAAGMGGKIKMVAQSFGIAGLILPWHTFLPLGFAQFLVYASYGLIGIGLVFAISSAVEYILEARKITRP
ncbi:CDP-diacylglycerol--glycerol-3-phosphate 3-phosphatidyltransferase [Arcanobacterium pinnipediorum]|uniref:CDP-diacylglycerol--glycerol-3-phosphate 3-phosphatidyltransferase n=1 Tax=Arcanobacterium pinnipediorum TaxID=1503041 RepID=A0ABY5ALC3_9ACTO|nr:CDP-diacylglycerol--glycerol-3-phosphate 3-phosphatidyltransferase [Arcanobacterium pinnipediorum]USR80003.1 CDP-diacylglycerol--glycerol-3-phosphate 3-phosphatidyltransferase [Arcanobacterium pinnipediorum]